MLLSIAFSASTLNPLAPVAMPSSAFFSLSDPTFEPVPLGVRVLGGVAPLGDSSWSAEGVNLLYTGVGVSSTIGRGLALDSRADMRVALGDALVSVPGLLSLELRYALLNDRGLSLSLSGGGNYGASMKGDLPENGRGEFTAHATAGGSLGVFRWALQTGTGYRQSSSSDARARTLPLHAGAGLVAPLAGATELTFEFTTEGSATKTREVWDMLAVAGLRFPIGATAGLQLAATAMQTGRGSPSIGGLIAFSGRLGLGDLDSDGVPDEIDACPGLVGASTLQGCPFVDDDRDGVWDRLDACPTEPGPEQSAGCPVQDFGGRADPQASTK